MGVAIRRVCEALGVATQRQLTKLHGKAWACVTIMVTHDSSGRKQEVACIDLDSLPMWLATIDPSRVAPAVALPPAATRRRRQPQRSAPCLNQRDRRLGWSVDADVCPGDIEKRRGFPSAAVRHSRETSAFPECYPGEHSTKAGVSREWGRATTAIRRRFWTVPPWNAPRRAISVARCGNRRAHRSTRLDIVSTCATMPVEVHR
ncbi:MAG: phage antirepressor N-terminal domain-containing protein [Polyangiales bacterium]